MGFGCYEPNARNLSGPRRKQLVPFIKYTFTFFSRKISKPILSQNSRITFEFPATGGVIPLARFRTVKLLKYVSASDYFIMACEFIFCAFIFYYYVEEALEIKKHKLSYFFSIWNNLDIVVLLVNHLFKIPTYTYYDRGCLVSY